MKKLISLIAVIAALAFVSYGQTNNYEIRSVRDPVQFKDKINADMAAVDTRLDSLEGATTQAVGTNGTLRVLAIDGTNNLVFVWGSVTNVIDADVDN